jgi:signal recognition particle GTPase
MRDMGNVLSNWFKRKTNNGADNSRIAVRSKRSIIVIVFMGIAGSGKSLQGRKLADTMSLPWLIHW